MILSIVLFVAVAFFTINHDFTKPKTFDVEIAGVTLEVGVARTPAERTTGLSGVASLSEDEGMLFVFEKPDTYDFWMKGMLFPLDIIWLDQDKKVIHIEKNALPESYPKAFGPDQNSAYVLEVVAGFSDKHKLKIGDQAEFDF